MSKFITVLLSGSVVVALLCSFGLHSVQVQHSHYSFSHTASGHGHSHAPDLVLLDEYMHMADKKLFLILSLIVLLGLTFRTTYTASWIQFVRHLLHWYRTVLSGIRAAFSRPYNYLTLCFSQGILHPKLH